MRKILYVIINDVSGKAEMRLQTWFASSNYQIYDQISQKSFILYINDPSELVKAFASDSNRMSIASFETLQGISKCAALPKSTSWFVIQLYYAAFYAAHAILRFIGISCSQLERAEISSVEKIAEAYGVANTVDISGGFYKCVYEHGSKSLKCDKLDVPQKGSSHEKMWNVFKTKMCFISDDILKSPGLSIEKQRVSTKISEICDALGISGANWLSNVRNQTTYRHNYGTWYPYTNAKDYYQGLFGLIDKWKDDPLSISIWPYQDRDLQKYTEICVLIISICREMIIDMSTRCSNGKSFHEYGTLSLVKQVNRNLHSFKFLNT